MSQNILIVDDEPLNLDVLGGSPWGTLSTSWTNSLSTFSVTLCIADFRQSHHAVNVRTLYCYFCLDEVIRLPTEPGRRPEAQNICSNRSSRSIATLSGSRRFKGFKR